MFFTAKSTRYRMLFMLNMTTTMGSEVLNIIIINGRVNYPQRIWCVYMELLKMDGWESHRGLRPLVRLSPEPVYGVILWRRPFVFPSNNFHRFSGLPSCQFSAEMGDGGTAVLHKDYSILGCILVCQSICCVIWHCISSRSLVIPQYTVHRCWVIPPLQYIADSTWPFLLCS